MPTLDEMLLPSVGCAQLEFHSLQQCHQCKLPQFDQLGLEDFCHESLIGSANILESKWHDSNSTTLVV